MPSSALWRTALLCSANTSVRFPSSCSASGSDRPRFTRLCGVSNSSITSACGYATQMPSTSRRRSAVVLLPLANTIRDGENPAAGRGTYLPKVAASVGSTGSRDTVSSSSRASWACLDSQHMYTTRLVRDCQYRFVGHGRHPRTGATLKKVPMKAVPDASVVLRLDLRESKEPGQRPPRRCWLSARDLTPPGLATVTIRPHSIVTSD